jgi:hypothetical protein
VRKNTLSKISYQKRPKNMSQNDKDLTSEPAPIVRAPASLLQ